MNSGVARLPHHSYQLLSGPAAVALAVFVKWFQPPQPPQPLKLLNPPTGCGGRYPQIIFTLHPVKPECQLINAHFLCLTIDSVFIGQFHKLPDQKEASGPTHCSLSFPPLLSALFSKGFLISLSACQVLLQLVFLHSGSHTNEDDRVIICQSQVSVIRAYV